MLNPSKIKDSFDKIINKIMKRYITITISTLMALASINPKNVYAIGGDTIASFRSLSQDAQILINNTRVINPDGSVSYNISDKDKKEINKKFKDLIKRLKEEVDTDIKNLDWGRTESLLDLIYSTVYSVSSDFNIVDDNIVDEIPKLRKKVLDNFELHVDLTMSGVYTLKGSKRVYVISYGSSDNNLDMAIVRSALDAQLSLIKYLKTKRASMWGFGQVILSNAREDGGKSQVYELRAFMSGGEVTLPDGTVFTEKDIAQKLELENKFLPLR